MMLDLYAAFDTVDHAILAMVQSSQLGVEGGTHNWLTDFLGKKCSPFTEEITSHVQL